MSHATLAVRHCGAQAQTGDNISAFYVNNGIREGDSPVTIDHGSNVVAASRNNV